MSLRFRLSRFRSGGLDEKADHAAAENVAHRQGRIPGGACPKFTASIGAYSERGSSGDPQALNPLYRDEIE